MAIFGHGKDKKLFTPTVLPPRGGTPRDWDNASTQLDYERAMMSNISKLERYLGEDSRRKLGALRLAQSGGYRYPVLELAPAYDPVECDACRSKLPLSQMREIIQWEDTRLQRPHRIWYACSLACSEFVKRQLATKIERERHTPAPGSGGYATRAPSTIPLLENRGRQG